MQPAFTTRNKCGRVHFCTSRSPVANVRASLLSPGVQRLQATPSGSWRTCTVMTHRLGAGSEPNDDKTAGRGKPTARSALTGERLTTTPQSRAPDGHLGKAPALGLEGWVLRVLSFDVLTKWPKNYRVSSWPSLAKSQKKSQFYLKKKKNVIACIPSGQYRIVYGTTPSTTEKNNLLPVIGWQLPVR